MTESTHHVQPRFNSWLERFAYPGRTGLSSFVSKTQLTSGEINATLKLFGCLFKLFSKCLDVLRNRAYSFLNSMRHLPTPTRIREITKTASHGLSRVPRFLRLTVNRAIYQATSRGLLHVKRDLELTFICGPKLLLTSRISGKCAAIMTMMCIPSLFCCFMLTIPGFIFQSPQQNAYFYFSKVLNEDPARWIVLLLAGTCTLMSLAIPATMSESTSTYRY